MSFNPGWVSYLFQFFPDSLRHFHKVVQTTSYAFYSIDSSLKQDLKYSPFFDSKIYEITYGEEPKEKTIEAVELNYHKLLNLYNDAVRFVARGEFANALGKITTIHNSVPHFEHSRALEAFWYQNMRDYNRACSLYTIYLMENPTDLAVATTVFSIMSETQRIQLGKGIYRQNSKGL